jgi:amino acid adenylation domain-containing protein
MDLQVLFAELADLSEAFAVGTAYILTPIRSITRESTSDSIEYTADYQSSTSAYACLLNALRGIQEGRVHDAWGWTEEIQNATSNIPTNLPCDNPIIECLNMANEAFWRQYLAGCEGTVFPQIPATVRQVRCIGKADYRISLADGIAEKSHSVIASVIQTSWALLVGQYTESQDVIIKSCNIPQNGTIDDAFAIPIRFKVCKDRFTGELSQHADELTRIVLSKQVDPPGAHTEKWTSCLAQNPPVLVQLHGEAVDLSPEAFHTGQVNSTDCGLLLHCVVFKDEIRIRAHFDPQVIDPQQTQRLLYQLSHVMKQVCRPDIRVGDIDFLSSNDRQEIASWNSGVGPSNACIHTLISHQVQRCPQAPAVSASDGDLTYRELENHANRLAAHLVRLGIRPGNFVPTLFEKSMWTQVAVLAILKTGAAFVMLDPAHPASRNRLICQKVGSQIVVASPRLEKALCGEGAVPRVVTLSQDLMAGLPALDVSEHELLPSPNPYTGAYVLFTSGSTGQPKGALLEHRSFSAAARSVIAITGITPTTRVLQFSSYSFGAALIEMLATLIAGGCVCVPTDAERFSGSIADVIATHRVNWAFMTPSMARTLDPTSIRLQTLVTGGESVTPELVHAWAPHVDVFTVYGSAEQSTMAALGGPLLASESGARVGRPFSGCYAWIVDPDDVNRLAPVGCVGELVLEGALVARGYLDEPDKNVTAFPDGCRLAWRSGFAPHPDGPGQTRFYRTGDLLRYKGKDGTLEFVARRDGYVKLRGQRIELGEVEFQLMEAMKVPSELCVEIIVPKGATSLDQAALMAFIVLGDAYDGEDVESGDELIPSLKNRTLAAERLGSDVETRLANTLPAHMVPHFFFPLRRLPLTVSGKIVRKALRARAGRLSSQQLAELSLNRAAVRKEPTSELELYLQSVWAQLLVVPVSTISVDDSFFQVGGDSIKAIKLFRRLRADGYDLDVPGILASPVLSQMALKCQSRKS